MFQRILVPLDGSSFGETALPRALELTAGLDASIELVTVANPGSADDPLGSPTEVGDDSLETARTHANEYLEGVERRVREGGFSGDLERAVIPAGNVARALVRHLHERACDLTVMSTHGRGPIERAWLGSSADALIRRSPAPVLLLRPSEGAEESLDVRGSISADPEPMRRVLFPLDGSGEAERMLDVAMPLIHDESAGECILLRVVPPFVPGGSPYLPHVVREAESQAMVEKAAWSYLESVSDRMPCARSEVRVVTDSQAAPAILRVAEDHEVDLIAMSTAGRGGVARLFLGSVADKVVRGAGVPVLLHRDPPEA